MKSILTEELARVRLRNPRYSMRAFAAKIGVAQSVVSELLQGKRPFTKKTARRVLVGLMRSPVEIEEILENSTGEKTDYVAFDRDAFYLISDWYHPAILSLAQTEDFQGKPKWIASRLGISPEIAENALERLIRLNLLVRDGKKLAPNNNSYAALSPTPHLALRVANQENLVLAEKALSQIAVEERDFTALTLCFDPDRIEEARRMIQSFRRKFDRVMESGRKLEVYKLCIQLFPLTKLPKRGSKS